MHNGAASVVRRSVFAAALGLCIFATSGCSNSKDPSLIGTFRMGEKVQAGPLVYTVLEADWRTALTESGGRTPTNRFLFLRVSIQNTGQNPVDVPGMELRGPGDKTYQEVTENMEPVQNWLGLLRRVQPSSMETGFVVFDAPVGAYQLAVSDGGDIDNERLALIEIPAELQ